MTARNAADPQRSKILQALEDQDTSVILDDALENQMILNMGPQHPATHGVLRLLLKLDGETVVGSVPELGYLHRGYEKIAENGSYHEFIPHTDRLDYLSPISNNVAYVLAVEKLLGLEVPRRAQYIRVLVSEMARIASHLVSVGSMAMDVGALTVLLWTFREREKLLDIYDVLCGARFTTSYARIGGLQQDWTAQCTAMLRQFLGELEADLVDVEKLLSTNRIFIDRCQDVGHISREDAIAAAMHYPAGLNAAKTFAAVNAPFAPNAYRYENGQVMAGPDCKFAPGCQNISTQSLAIFERLGDVQTRVIAVDERMGIVWLRMAWGVRERGGDQLTVWEAFKVYDGQIHAVEAFMRILPVEKRNGGWE